VETLGSDSELLQNLPESFEKAMGPILLHGEDAGRTGTPAASVIEMEKEPLEEAERHNLRGKKFFEAESLDEAIAVFRHAVALEPSNRVMRTASGSQEFKEAEDYLRHLEEL